MKQMDLDFHYSKPCETLVYLRKSSRHDTRPPRPTNKKRPVALRSLIGPLKVTFDDFRV